MPVQAGRRGRSDHQPGTGNHPRRRGGLQHPPLYRPSQAVQQGGDHHRTRTGTRRPGPHRRNRRDIPKERGRVQPAGDEAPQQRAGRTSHGRTATRRLYRRPEESVPTLTSISNCKERGSFGKLPKDLFPLNVTTSSPKRNPIVIRRPYLCNVLKKKKHGTKKTLPHTGVI